MMSLLVWSHVPSVQGAFCPEGSPFRECLPPSPVNRQTGVKTLPSFAVGNNTYDIEYPKCHNCLAKNGDDIIQKGLVQRLLLETDRK